MSEHIEGCLAGATARIADLQSEVQRLRAEREQMRGGTEDADCQKCKHWRGYPDEELWGDCNKDGIGTRGGVYCGWYEPAQAAKEDG